MYSSRATKQSNTWVNTGCFLTMCSVCSIKVSRESVDIRSLCRDSLVPASHTHIMKAGNETFVGMAQNTLSNNYVLIKLPVLLLPRVPHSRMQTLWLVKTSFQSSQCVQSNDVSAYLGRQRGKGSPIKECILRTCSLFSSVCFSLHEMFEKLKHLGQKLQNMASSLFFQWGAPPPPSPLSI